MKEEESFLKCHSNVGVNIHVNDPARINAIVLTGGATAPRDLYTRPGLNGIHFAMDFLKQTINDRRQGLLPTQRLKAILRCRNNSVWKKCYSDRGGDTGSDCVGTSNRQELHQSRSLNYAQTAGRQDRIHALAYLSHAVKQPRPMKKDVKGNGRSRARNL
jgi:NADPH-dependent glutamate synthase beta subunit-like oxidoreductase